MDQNSWPVKEKSKATQH